MSASSPSFVPIATEFRSADFVHNEPYTPLPIPKTTHPSYHVSPSWKIHPTQFNSFYCQSNANSPIFSQERDMYCRRFWALRYLCRWYLLYIHLGINGVYLVHLKLLKMARQSSFYGLNVHLTYKTYFQKRVIANRWAEITSSVGWSGSGWSSYAITKYCYCFPRPFV